MAKADIWMPLFIGDYLADTTRLTTEQHGAYLLLIMDYWRNGAPPDDDAILANITKMQPKEWKRMRPSLMGFFAIEGGILKHSRIEHELSEATKSKEKSEAKAKKAAEARWGKASTEHAQSESPSNATGNAPSIPHALHEQCPSPSPLPVKAKPTSKAEAKPAATATRLPADWKPRESEIEFCKAERPDLDPGKTAEKFRDYWTAQPGLRGRKTDWTATWRNWVRDERRPYAVKADPDRRQSRHNGFDQLDYSEGVTADGRIN